MEDMFYITAAIMAGIFFIAILYVMISEIYWSWSG